MELYEIGAGITALLMFGAMFLTQMPKAWHTTGGWLLMSLAVIPLFILAICLCLNYPPLLFSALIFMGFSASRGFK